MWLSADILGWSKPSPASAQAVLARKGTVKPVSSFWFQVSSGTGRL